MRYIFSIGISLCFGLASLPAFAKKVQWCAVQTNNGKVVKCHTNPKSCERYVKGRFNWTCVPMNK